MLLLAIIMMQVLTSLETMEDVVKDSIAMYQANELQEQGSEIT
jgi:hypothetical protein